ncbi:hypothetical protein L6164_036772 [Bauhinia variegata]|uniref:Uncharacterized protein n=1 Tax=Bauhinia variegata TaxID=167791 RepID=A0ACB9KI55_BAUVA|nr:hypothetical protein L6164_036772 [Bauhinia variegata]
MAMLQIFKVVMITVAIMPWFSRAMDDPHLRQLAAKYNVTCVLIFGDSSVDAGNNNALQTTMKSNFLPYGKDFFNGIPTGRFSNGRLPTDFIAEALGFKQIVPAFLDPNLKLADLPYGVSFASAATGYDDYTANISNVLSVSKQLEYFAHYKIHMRKLLGKNRAEFIIRNALFILSMGTNDFLQNYYLVPDRPKQFSVEQFQNFLVSKMSHDIEVMYRLGARRIVIVGVPPLGCIPLTRTLMSQKDCVESLNRVAYSFNAKQQQKLTKLKAKLGLMTAYLDVYGIIRRAVADPKAYGFEEVSKGCCGTGTVEYGDSCKGMSTCSDPTKYVFWDAVHPTEKMYGIIADEATETIAREFIG